MQVSVPSWPSTQRRGEHCRATTTAAVSAHEAEMASKVYEVIMTKRLGWRAMRSMATAHLDDPSDKKSKMFDA